MVNVLVVVGIIAFMAAASVPYIRNFQPRFELNSIKKQVASDLRYAQQSTVTQQIPHGVRFDDDLNAYEVIKMNNKGTSTVKYQELTEEISIKEVAGSSDDLVEFDFYGGVDESCEAVLEHSSGDTGRVIVKPSGYIKIQ